MAHGTGHTEDGPLQGGQLSAATSNKVVQLLSEYTGRGPTRARTVVSDGLVVCTLQDTLTKGEKALVSRGQVNAVLDIRRTFQAAMRAEAEEAIEHLTGRKVVAFMSDNHVDPDVAVEIFMLQAEDGDGPAPTAVDDT
jgi:uncharacterized protein YbcI